MSKDHRGFKVLAIRYQYSDLGRDLFEAGHVSGSREYATGLDPFKWPKELREAAFLGTGIEYDDEAAYTRARAAMAPQGRSITDLFLRNREEILARYGEMLFPAADRKERRKRLKAVTSGFEMDSGLDAWRQKWGEGAARSSLRGATITVQGGRTSTGRLLPSTADWGLGLMTRGFGVGRWWCARMGSVTIPSFGK